MPEPRWWDALAVERIDDLLSEGERKKLDGDIKQLADLRRRVEVECRDLPMK